MYTSEFSLYYREKFYDYNDDFTFVAVISSSLDGAEVAESQNRDLYRVVSGVTFGD